MIQKVKSKDDFSFYYYRKQDKEKKKTVNICKYEQIEKQNYHKSLTVNVRLIIVFNLSYVNLILTRTCFCEL